MPACLPARLPSGLFIPPALISDVSGGKAGGRGVEAGQMNHFEVRLQIALFLCLFFFWRGGGGSFFGAVGSEHTDEAFYAKETDF